MATKYTTGERVHALRVWRELSIRTLAAECGLKRSAVHRIELDHLSPREDKVNKVAKGLRVTWAELYDDAFIARAIRETKARESAKAGANKRAA